jgi:nucleotide-binding universal stress UspA family protein
MHKAHNQFKKNQIVVGVDGSPAAINALKWATALTERMGSTLKIVTTWDGTFVAIGLAAFGGVDPDTDSIESRQLVANEIQIKTLIGVFGNEPLPDWITTAIVQGKPAEALIEASQSADLLVLGTRGHGQMVELVLGSDSAECVLHARCPVTVIREDTAL